MSTYELYKIERSEHPVLRQFLEAINEMNLSYFANDIGRHIGYATEQELDNAIRLLINSMSELHINIPSNVKCIYRGNGNKIFQDWKLSQLALVFLISNAPNKSHETELIQLKLLTEYFNKN